MQLIVDLQLTESHVNRLRRLAVCVFKGEVIDRDVKNLQESTVDERDAYARKVDCESHGWMEFFSDSFECFF